MQSSARRVRRAGSWFCTAGLAAACAGCLPTLTNTPSVAPFALAESDWGRADERLVIACYRIRRSPRQEPEGVYYEPFFYRVLMPSSRNEYATPNTLAWGGWAGDGMIPVVGPAAQYVPMHVILTAEQGNIHHVSDYRHQWNGWPFDRIARVVDSGSALYPSGESRPGLNSDCVLGFVLCRILMFHDPEHQFSLAPHERISKADAKRIASFVQAHAKYYSRATQMLSRRLVDRYDRNGPRIELGQWAGQFAVHQPPNIEQVLSQLDQPEREYFERVRVELAATLPALDEP